MDWWSLISTGKAELKAKNRVEQEENGMKGGARLVVTAPAKVMPRIWTGCAPSYPTIDGVCLPGRPRGIDPNTVPDRRGFKRVLMENGRAGNKTSRASNCGSR